MPTSRQSYLRRYNSPTASAHLDMYHLTCGISSRHRSINLILFTGLLLLTNAVKSYRLQPH